METIWQSIADEIWVCRVERIDERRGRLTVSKKDSELVILNEEVGLSYGAVFGPDVADVDDWQNKCLGAIDAQ